jgi:hypothetical protein
VRAARHEGAAQLGAELEPAKRFGLRRMAVGPFDKTDQVADLIEITVFHVALAQAKDDAFAVVWPAGGPRPDWRPRAANRSPTSGATSAPLNGGKLADATAHQSRASFCRSGGRERGGGVAPEG